MKVEDKVECVDNKAYEGILNVGEVYTISHLNGIFVGLVELEDTNPQHFAGRFRLVFPSESFLELFI